MLFFLFKLVDSWLVLVACKSLSQVIAELGEAVARQEIAALVNIVFLKDSFAHFLKVCTSHPFKCSDMLGSCRHFV